MSSYLDKRPGFGSKGARGIYVPYQARRIINEAQGKQVKTRWEQTHFPMPARYHGRLKRCMTCGGRTMVSNLARMQYRDEFHMMHTIIEIASVCPECDGTGVLLVNKSKRGEVSK